MTLRFGQFCPQLYYGGQLDVIIHHGHRHGRYLVRTLRRGSRVVACRSVRETEADGHDVTRFFETRPDEVDRRLVRCRRNPDLHSCPPPTTLTLMTMRLGSLRRPEC